MEQHSLFFCFFGKGFTAAFVLTLENPLKEFGSNFISRKSKADVTRLHQVHSKGFNPQQLCIVLCHDSRLVSNVFLCL